MKVQLAIVIFTSISPNIAPPISALLPTKVLSVIAISLRVTTMAPPAKALSIWYLTPSIVDIRTLKAVATFDVKEHVEMLATHVSICKAVPLRSEPRNEVFVIIKRVTSAILLQPHSMNVNPQMMTFLIFINSNRDINSQVTVAVELLVESEMVSSREVIFETRRSKARLCFPGENTSVVFVMANLSTSAANFRRVRQG